jgi:hypothetical protein
MKAVRPTMTAATIIMNVRKSILRRELSAAVAMAGV